MKPIALLFSLYCLAAVAVAAEPVQVLLETNRGTIELSLDAEKAPASVENFLAYVDSGFYDGTVFHRVIPNFMIQGGGLTPDLERKDTRAPIPNESANGLKNERGTIAMARTGEPHSATAQFFINLKDNAFLDRANARDGWGYTVFGRVSAGIEVVDDIAAVRTTVHGGRRDVPTEPIILNRATRKVAVENPTGEKQ